MILVLKFCFILFMDKNRKFLKAVGKQRNLQDFGEFCNFINFWGWGWGWGFHFGLITQLSILAQLGIISFNFVNYQIISIDLLNYQSNKCIIKIN